MSPKMPANVFLKFFIVSSPSGPTSAMVASSSPSFSWLVSGLSLGRSGCFLTAEVALLVAETELVSEAENNQKLVVIFVTILLKTIGAI